MRMLKVILGKIEVLDFTAVMALQKRRQRRLSKLMTFITLSGTGQSWFIASIVLTVLDLNGVIIVSQQVTFLRSLVAGLLAWALGLILKKFIARRRPPERLADFAHESTRPACGSFPSSHASASFAFFSPLAMKHHPLAPLIGIWALMVTFSRVYLGVHFPSDLVAGVALGSACGTMILPALFKALGIAF